MGNVRHQNDSVDKATSVGSPVGFNRRRWLQGISTLVLTSFSGDAKISKEAELQLKFEAEIEAIIHQVHSLKEKGVTFDPKDPRPAAAINSIIEICSKYGFDAKSLTADSDRNQKQILSWMLEKSYGFNITIEEYGREGRTSLSFYFAKLGKTTEQVDLSRIKVPGIDTSKLGTVNVRFAEKTMEIPPPLGSLEPYSLIAGIAVDLGETNVVPIVNVDLLQRWINVVGEEQRLTSKSKSQMFESLKRDYIFNEVGHVMFARLTGVSIEDASKSVLKTRDGKIFTVLHYHEAFSDLITMLHTDDLPSFMQKQSNSSAYNYALSKEIINGMTRQYLESYKMKDMNELMIHMRASPELAQSVRASLIDSFSATFLQALPTLQYISRNGK